MVALGLGYTDNFCDEAGVEEEALPASDCTILDQHHYSSWPEQECLPGFVLTNGCSVVTGSRLTVLPSSLDP
jgi:hypothetical protein